MNTRLFGVGELAPPAGGAVSRSRSTSRLGAGFPWLPVVALLFLIPAQLPGVPSNRKVLTYVQPDGQKFQAILFGDENRAFHKTVSGEPILQNPATGFWHYAAARDDGTLLPTPDIVGRPVGRAGAAEAGLAPWRRAVEQAVKERVRRDLRTSPGSASPATSGTLRAVILLANFSDTTPLFAPSDFVNLLNTTGYSSNGASGSVRDYYLEISYGALTIQTDVVGWFSLPQTRAYYGANIGGVAGYDQNPQQMVIDAIAASDGVVDYSNYDADGDGWVDFLGVIHQGQGEEQGGGNAAAIWSHCWWLPAPVVVDGKSVQIYHTEPERLYGGLTTIGVICHEMGHMFGLPDLYDTDSTSLGLGYWSLMAYGSWLGAGYNGAKPCHMDAYCKYVLGWLVPAVAIEPGVQPLEAFDRNSSALLVPVDPYQDGEYFLISNRYARNSGVASTGFDRYVPGSGALVLHVDDYMWGNDNEARKKVDVEEADGLAQLDAMINAGDSADLYPNGQPSFSPSTGPSTTDNDGVPTSITLHSFTGAGSESMTCFVAPRALSGEAIVYDPVGAYTSFGYEDDGDDMGCVRFTTATGGSLRRIKTFFPHDGTTTYTLRVFSGWDGTGPFGLIASQFGTHAGVGYLEIPLSPPLFFLPGGEFAIEIRYDTRGGYNWPIPASGGYSSSGNSYIRSNELDTYYALSDESGYPYEVNIRADFVPTSPTVTIARNGPTPTNSGTVEFAAAFSRDVYGIDAGDFAPHAPGLSGVSVAAVSGSGRNYWVTVSTGMGSGVARLDMIAGAGATDLYGSGVSNAPYSQGESFTIDRTPAIASLNPLSDRTRVGTSIPLNFAAADSFGDGAIETGLWVKQPGGASFVDTGLRAAGVSGSFLYLVAGGNGPYAFATLASDALGNAEAIPAEPEAGALVNTVENGPFAWSLSSGDSTTTYPMTNDLDVVISISGAATSGTLTVSRSAPRAPAPPDLIGQHLLDESLSIVSSGFGAGWTASLLWPFDPAGASSLLPGYPLDTVFETRDGALLRAVSVVPSDGTLFVTGIDSFSDWFAGNFAATAVPDWAFMGEKPGP